MSMEKRGFATRIRSYPVPDGSVAEMIFFSPPLIITEQQIELQPADPHPESVTGLRRDRRGLGPERQQDVGGPRR